MPLFVFFGLAPLVMWGPLYRRLHGSTMSRSRALLLGLANWPYTYVHHVAIWWAFARVVRVRHDWKKTVRVVAWSPLALRALALGHRVAPGVVRMSSDRGPVAGHRVVRGRLRVAPPVVPVLSENRRNNEIKAA